jgi:hypothetical protein
MFINDNEILQLVSTGCSFTYGYGLQDLEQAWPSQLAKNLEIDCVNLAQTGAGNDHIIKTIIDYFVQKKTHRYDSMVAIGLTAYSRVEFLHKNSEQCFYTIPNLKLEKEFIEVFFKERYNDRYYYLKYLRTIISLQSILAHWKIPYLMFESIPNNHHVYENDNDAQSLISEIDLTNCYKMFGGHFKSITDHTEKLPDGHPNAFAHKQMADLLYTHIINNYGAENGK